MGRTDLIKMVAKRSWRGSWSLKWREQTYFLMGTKLHAYKAFKRENNGCCISYRRFCKLLQMRAGVSKARRRTGLCDYCQGWDLCTRPRLGRTYDLARQKLEKLVGKEHFKAWGAEKAPGGKLTT